MLDPKQGKLNKNYVSDFVIDIDYELVESIKNDKDITAFTALMNKYKKRVFNFCLRYTGNNDDADDIAQDVFIKVYKNIEGFRGDSSFSTWLFRITANTCKNNSRWRKTRKMDEVMRLNNLSPDDDKDSNMQINDPNLNPAEIIDNEELKIVIGKAVQKLKPKQRTAVILKDFMGKSYDEIAQIMKTNIGTVKSTLSRGRLNVAKQIEEYCKI
jgi:RNA polymerase sigma-70 factor (ECF subfamily)